MLSEGAKVRAAVAVDLAGVLELYRQLSPNDPKISPERSNAIWADILATPGVTVFVVEAEGCLVATCKLIVTPNLTRSGRPFALIEKVVTHADARRRGFGRAVLEAAITAPNQGDS